MMGPIFNKNENNKLAKLDFLADDLTENLVATKIIFLDQLATF